VVHEQRRHGASKGLEILPKPTVLQGANVVVRGKRRHVVERVKATGFEPLVYGLNNLRHDGRVLAVLA
jgi:hypothetical protein